MNNISTVISILITVAIIVLVIYLLNAIYRIKIVKDFINELSDWGELTFLAIGLWIFCYPMLFFGLCRDAYLKKHSKKKSEEKYLKYYIEWRHVFGLHLPILLLWIAAWLYIIKFIIIKFFI